MDLAKTFENPYVLIGGAALGLILLMSKGGTAAAATSTNASSTTAVAAYNQAALGAVTQQASIAADVAKTNINADVTKTLGLYSTLASMQQNNDQLAATQSQSSAGITNNMITSNAAIVIDQSNNATRLGLGQQQVTATSITANAQVQIAQEQAKAAKNAAQMGALSSVLGTVGKLVAAPFTGGASLLIPTGAPGDTMANAPTSVTNSLAGLW